MQMANICTGTDWGRGRNSRGQGKDGGDNVGDWV